MPRYLCNAPKRMEDRLAKLPENMGGCNEMKPTADLEARIMNRLQTMNHGQTIEQTYLGEPQSKILTVLMPLQRVGYVTEGCEASQK